VNRPPDSTSGGAADRDAGSRRRAAVEQVDVVVVGARLAVAALVGAWTPYRISRNGRGLVFRYLQDPLAGGIEAETLYQWREGDSFAFCCAARATASRRPPARGSVRSSSRS
jgi:hypothetical protein